MKGALSLVAVAALSAVGCVESSFPEGLTCDGPDGKCPSGQSCFATAEGMKCFSSAPIDAAPGDPDAPAAAIDAAAAPCDLINQTGCEVGQSCYFRSVNEGGPFCAITGTVGQGPGATCTNMTDCVRGAGCFFDGMGMVCRDYCTAALESAICRPLDACEIVADDIGFCRFDGCDPVMQDCAPVDACYFDSMPMIGVCRPPGTAGTQGAACTTFDSCARSFHCQICPSADDACARYCNTDNGDADCADLPGTPACEALPNAGTVGVCDACP